RAWLQETICGLLRGNGNLAGLAPFVRDRDFRPGLYVGSLAILAIDSDFGFFIPSHGGILARGIGNNGRLLGRIDALTLARQIGGVSDGRRYHETSQGHEGHYQEPTTIHATPPNQKK